MLDRAEAPDLRPRHPLADKVVRVDLGEHPHFQFPDLEHVIVIDWWDRLTGRSWMISDGNPAAMIYAVRTSSPPDPTPIDNEVVYVKTSRQVEDAQGHLRWASGFGVLLHASELREEVADAS